MRPLYVLAPLVLVQWAVTARLASTAQHDGWLFYHGGDGTYYWTTTWSLAHHQLPATVISYGLPVVLWPIGLLAGPNILVGLPTVIVLQVLVLAPIGVLVMYALGARIGGRLFGYLAVAGWIAAPLVAIWFVNGGDTATPPPDLRNLLVPNALGLTPLGDYASMILALVAIWLVVRALDDRRWNDVIFGSLATGALIAIKPSNAYVLLAPLVGFAGARRWREGLAFAALLVPPLVTLAVWKQVGLGRIPIASPEPVALAAGSNSLPGPEGLHRYFVFDWDTLSNNIEVLREESRFFWALAVITIAGMVGLIRRAPLPGITIATWFLTYLLFKGGAKDRASVDSTSFFRLVMPAFPAFVLTALSVVFLNPRIARRAYTAVASSPPTLAALAVAAVALVYPLVVVATATPWSEGKIVSDHPSNVLVPVSGKLEPHVRVRPDAVLLSWRPVGGPTKVFYRVLRSGRLGCLYVSTSGSRDCEIDMTTAGFTRRTKYVDRWPPSGGNTYRIGVYAGWTGRLRDADLLLVGPPVTVEVS